MGPLSERWGKPVLNKWNKKIYLDQMSTKELEERVRENDIIFLPIGSTESHGIAEPLGEDTIIGVSIAERVCYETGCTVAPPISYGSHPSHHYGMKGTIPVKKTAFLEYVTSVVKWLSHAGFKKIILWNSHGQEYLLPAVKDMAIIEEGVHALILVTSWWKWVADLLRRVGEEIAPGVVFKTPFVHADEVEASVTWYVAPDLVDPKLLPESRAKKMVRVIPGKWVNAAGNVFPDKPFNWYDPSHLPEVYYYPNGVVGDPTEARPEKGKVLVDKCIERVVEFVEWLKKTYPPGKVPRVWIDEDVFEHNKPAEWVEPEFF